MVKIKVDDEDEDIVIQGSALYEHLQNLGYRDFESIPVHKTSSKQNSYFKVTSFLQCMKDVFKKLFSMYSWVMQEESISRIQLEAISNAKALLDDHANMIHNYLQEYSSESWRTALQRCIITVAMVTSSLYMSLKTKYKIPPIIFVSSTLLVTGYIKYLRLSAHKDLKSVVSLQDELFNLCKKGLKILRYGYKIKINKGKSGQQFYDLTADRLKYLQPLTESLIRCMKNASFIYYKVSTILVKLLPSEIPSDDLWTRFDKESFEFRGEVNYQALKDLYHVYILTQSETLHLLAIAYHRNTWRPFCRKLPEEKFAYIVRSLIKYLTAYKNELSQIIDGYYSCKSKPLARKYNGPISCKWQDLYVHLYLTSNKLQTAHNYVLSIMKDIDNATNEAAIDEDESVEMMEKLNEAYKQIDAARNFAEFSTLLMAKTKLDTQNTSHSLERNTMHPDVNSDLPVIGDTEVEIMDEVFEEYIKEEYLKPLYEEGDDGSLESYKWDKFLAKNFMIELKEALIDKQKSMSERESKALRRMYKNITKDNESKTNGPRIPTPPPMPPYDIFSTVQKAPTLTSSKTVSNRISDEDELPNYKSKSVSERKSKGETFYKTSDEEIAAVPFIPLPTIQAQSAPFALSFPPPFLKAAEETFIGSGENSEEELSESADETNED